MCNYKNCMRYSPLLPGYYTFSGTMFTCNVQFLALRNAQILRVSRVIMYFMVYINDTASAVFSVQFLIELKL